ncbi:trypsin-like peptidase domain-containing protein, partial [bacterium]|nr:trypsin-like peptidase domain-containing protein [bacterium]
RIDNIDLGVIKFQSNLFYEEAKLGSSNTVSQGAKIYVSGFPLATTAVPKRIMRFLNGNVIANSNSKLPDGYQLLYSNPTLPGMSGGSVLNSQGYLVGIHGRGELDSKATEQSGVYIKTGTNLAVPISLYKASLRQTDQQYLDPTPDIAVANGYDEYIIQAANQSRLFYRDQLNRNDYNADKKRAQNVINLASRALAIKPSAKAYELKADMYRIMPIFTTSYPYEILTTNSINSITEIRLNSAKYAISLYTKALQLDPGNSSLHVKRGSIFEIYHYLFNNGQQRAIENYQEAISINPMDFDAYKNLIRTYRNDSQSQKSIIDQAIRKFPNKAKPYLFLSKYLMPNTYTERANLAKIREAMTAIRRAIELDPNEWESYYILANLHVDIMNRSKNYENIYSKYSSVVCDEFENCIRTRGWHQIRLNHGIGDPRKVLRNAYTAINLAPDEANPMAQLYSFLSMAKEYMGNLDGACKDWKTVVKYDIQQEYEDDVCKRIS